MKLSRLFTSIGAFIFPTKKKEDTLDMILERLERYYNRYFYTKHTTEASMLRTILERVDRMQIPISLLKKIETNLQIWTKTRFPSWYNGNGGYKDIFKKIHTEKGYTVHYLNKASEYVASQPVGADTIPVYILNLQDLADFSQYDFGTYPSNSYFIVLGDLTSARDSTFRQLSRIGRKFHENSLCVLKIPSKGFLYALEWAYFLANFSLDIGIHIEPLEEENQYTEDQLILLNTIQLNTYDTPTVNIIKNL